MLVLKFQRVWFDCWLDVKSWMEHEQQGHSSCRLPVQRWLSLILAKFSLHVWLRCLLVDLLYFYVNHIFFAGWDVSNITTDWVAHFWDLIIETCISWILLLVSVLLTEPMKRMRDSEIYSYQCMATKFTYHVHLFSTTQLACCSSMFSWINTTVKLMQVFFFLHCEATFWLLMAFICSLFAQGLRAQLRRPVSPGCFLLYQQVNICFVLFAFVHVRLNGSRYIVLWLYSRIYCYFFF